MKNVKTIAGLAGAAAGAAILSILLFRKRENGTTLANDLMTRARETGDSLARYGKRIRERLMHGMSGPNGEPVYEDMYARHFYEDAGGNRVYLETTA